MEKKSWTVWEPWVFATEVRSRWGSQTIINNYGCFSLEKKKKTHFNMHTKCLHHFFLSMLHCGKSGKQVAFRLKAMCLVSCFRVLESLSGRRGGVRVYRGRGVQVGGWWSISVMLCYHRCFSSALYMAKPSTANTVAPTLALSQKVEFFRSAWAMCLWVEEQQRQIKVRGQRNTLRRTAAKQKEQCLVFNSAPCMGWCYLALRLSTLTQIPWWAFLKAITKLRM